MRTQRFSRWGWPALLIVVAVFAFAVGQRQPMVAKATTEAAAGEAEEHGAGDGHGHEAEAEAGHEEEHGAGDGHGHEAEAGAEGIVKLTPDRIQATGIATTIAAEAPVAAALSLNGEVQPDGNRTAKVGSPVSGRLTELKVNVGARVRQGQTLAVVASRDVADAQSAVIRARAEEVAARARLQNVRALAATGALTRGPVEEAQNAFTAATASLRQAQVSLARAHSARDLAETELARKKNLAETGAFRARPVEDARGEVARGLGELETAQSAVKVKQAAYDRSTRLLTAGVAARRDVENAESELEQAKAQEREARTHCEVARQTLAREEEISRQNLYSSGEVQAAQAALRQAEKDVDDREAEVERTRGHLKVAAAVLAREKNVAGQNLLARKDLQEAESALLRARAEVQAGENALRALRATGGPGSGSPVSIPISAPISGVVTERSATPGQAVEATTDLFTIVGGESVWVWANVYEKDMPQVRAGQPARVSCPAHVGHVWEGRVGFVGTVSDEKTRSTKVRVDLPNPDGVLRPGMFVSVSLQLRRQRSALAIPVPAVQQMDNQYVVFVSRKAGEYERRTVRVGARSGSVYEVLGGVRAGEAVVTKNAFLLKSELMKDQLSEGCAH